MSPKLPALAVAAALASAVPSAAIDVPQSRQEFVAAIEGGREVPPETLRTDLPLDVKVTRTANVGYVERSSSDHNPTLRRVGTDRAEFTLQVEHNPRAVGHTPPEGGLYMMVADLRAIDGGHTEVVLYRPKMGVKKITASLMRWFAGDVAPCPDLR